MVFGFIAIASTYAGEESSIVVDCGQFLSDGHEGERTQRLVLKQRQSDVFLLLRQHRFDRMLLYESMK